MTFMAKVEKGAIPFPPGIELPEGTEVQVHSQDPASPERKARKGLLQFAGIIEGPVDLAAEHDHYIHGTPKRAST
jgi:hypothetical protein